jgi:hypothetical protein
MRKKPVFENFLKPPGNQNVLDAAADGPFIMLNQSEYRSRIDTNIIQLDNQSKF